MEGLPKTSQEILVVDDDQAVGELLARVLEREGQRPVVCHTAKDALGMAEKKRFALGFVDINLPDLSGLELASALKKVDAECELVFITGSGSFENAVQAIKVGAYDYLRKPLSVNDVLLCLKRFQERQALKARIRQAERRYFMLVQNIPVLIFVLDRDFGLEFVNEACSGMLGYSRAETMKEPAWLIGRIHPDDRERVKGAIQSAFASRAPFTLECRLHHREGRVVHGIMNSIPGNLTDADGIERGLEGFVVDITDRIELEKALVQKEMLDTLGAISAEVAHEIRNPLVSIGGFARRLKQRFPDRVESDVILRESERLERILSRITHYLRPVEIHPRLCSVPEIVQECLLLLDSDARQAAVRCRSDLDPEMPSVYLDPEILRQVFANLIRSAIEDMPKGETLVIEGHETDQKLRVQIRYRTAGSRSRYPEGIHLPFAESGKGIGVPLSYRLLKDIGGILSRRREDDFAVYTVTVPLNMPRTENGE